MEDAVASSTFSVGGLSTGMDTQSIIDKLVSLAQQPLSDLRKQQAAFRSQVSALGDLASKLGALRTASDDLASGGVLGLRVSSANSAFTARPGSTAAAGSYDIAVASLASAAKWRSGAFGAGDTLKGGTFDLGIDAFPAIGVDEGESLGKLASDINASGAPVSAAVLYDGAHSYLSVTAKSTGYAGADPSSALHVSFTAGPGDVPDPARLDPSAQAWSQDARNAAFTIDGLQFTRQSNTVADALPGATLTLQKLSPIDPGTQKPTAETLTLASDTDATQAKLKTFVDAYNALMQLVQKQTDVSPTTDRSTTLAGDGIVRGLEQALQSVGSSTVPGLATVRSLADLGVKTARDGTLSIDSAVLSAAIARDPAAVNAVFSDPTGGVGKLASTLLDGAGERPPLHPAEGAHRSDLLHGRPGREPAGPARRLPPVPGRTVHRHGDRGGPVQVHRHVPHPAVERHHLEQVSQR
jgi:flagellar hook-associated protein 2